MKSTAARASFWRTKRIGKYANCVCVCWNTVWTVVETGLRTEVDDLANNTFCIGNDGTNQKTGVWGAVSVGSVFMYLFMEASRSHIDIYSNVIPPSSLL